MVSNYKEILHDNESLDAGRTLLRKFRKDDAADILEYGSDELTLKFLVWDGVTTLDEAKAGIYDYHLANPNVYAVELKENKKCIGCIDLRMEPEHEKATFGYILNHRYWGKGYMTEALSAVITFCFEKLELNRVEAAHFAGNEGSGKVMQKCGMVYEGTTKQSIKVKGVFHDEVRYGITKEMWNSIQE